MSGASADVRNNILDKKVQNRDGGTNTQSNNLTLPSPTSTLWFKNAAARDFSLTTAGALLAKNKATVLSGVTADVNRVARPQNGAPDIGATEQ
jgi:hypothetical protein